MKKPVIEKVLTLLGALLILLFALGLFVPAIGAWQSEIRLLAVLGVVLYAAYSFWTQNNDAKALHIQELEAAKWRIEAQNLRESLNKCTSELKASQASLQDATAAMKALESELLECRQGHSGPGE